MLKIGSLMQVTVLGGLLHQKSDFCREIPRSKLVSGFQVSIFGKIFSSHDFQRLWEQSHVRI